MLVAAQGWMCISREGNGSAREIAESMSEQDREQQDETVLVAYVTVHLESGESFELLPFEDTQDVKSKVGDLLQDWAKSGFLTRGSQIVPWHQVRLIEATKVEELSSGAAQQQMEEWKAREVGDLRQSFWKTKKAREKKEEGDAPPAAAH
jgi:hypothetical protein